ncbi:MAG: [FeFe] hydrogenase H-cluster radical SAM maturase HydE [Eubacteriales bacterium]|jgi:biotin synthase
MSEVTELIEKLNTEGDLGDDEFLRLLGCRRTMTGNERDELRRTARIRADSVYGHDVYLRGLIEFTNYCRNDCRYCGIRRDNRELHRYRLTDDEILECCEEGYDLGFRTFVLQGGEDPGFSDDHLCEVVHTIRQRFPDVAITLSVGERERDVYQRFFDAGADRYLLRHETADAAHYRFMHPAELSMEHRMRCLYELKDIGFQIGAGFMVGSPGQTDRCYLEDFRFLQKLQPHMIGIGPFIPHHATPFKDYPAGTLSDTLFFISVLRLFFPKALIPATTALGTIDPTGREQGILAGANVVMPNLSPGNVRPDYLLYDGKICTDECAGMCRNCMQRRMQSIGYEVKEVRGDYPGFVYA